jgi:hypothetical protein
MDKIDSKDIEIIEPSKVGRPNFEFTPKILDQIKNMASYMCSKGEIATIIGCSLSTINRSELAQLAYEQGVAVAKQTIRKTQFDIATKLNSSQMAMWLGKVYLRQDRADEEDESNNPLPLTDIV